MDAQNPFMQWFENMPYSLVLLNESFEIIRQNKVFSEFFRHQSLQNQPFTTLLTPDNENIFKAIATQIKTEGGTSPKTDISLIHAEKHLVLTQMTIWRIDHLNQLCLMIHPHEVRYSPRLTQDMISLNQNSTIEQVLQSILDRIHEHVGYDAANVMLFDDDGFIHVKAQVGYPEDMAKWLDEQAFSKNAFSFWRKTPHHANFLLTRDTQKDPDWKTHIYSAWIRSNLSFPIQDHDNIIGLINLDSKTPNYFTARQGYDLIPFTNQIAVAIQNAQFFKQEREQRLLAEALHQCITAVTRSINFEEVTNDILDQISNVIPQYDHMSITLLASPDGIQMINSRNKSPNIDERQYYRQKWSISELPIINEMIKTQKAILVRDVATSELKPRQDEGSWVQSFMGAPMIAYGNTIGFIGLGSQTPNAFDENDQRLLRILAKPASAAIQNAQLYETLETERQQLNIILNGTAEGIIYTKGARIAYVNQALCDMTGYTAEELDNLPIMLLQCDEEATLSLLDVTASTDQRIASLAVGRKETLIQCKNDESFLAQLTISQLPDSENNNFVILVRNIDQERELRNLQTRFITHAAHELRQPLTSLSARLYLLQRSPERLKEHVKVLQNAIKRLTTITDHMSTVADFDLGNIELARNRVILQQLLLPIINEQQHDAEQRGITIKTIWQEDAFKARVDVSLIEEMVRLLLSHAIRHTPEQHTLHLMFGKIVQNEQTHVLIELSGSNPPQGKLSQIFRPFYTPSQGTIIHTGLELALAQKIVMLHEGTITANYTDEDRTTFRVLLPLPLDD